MLNKVVPKGTTKESMGRVWGPGFRASGFRVWGQSFGFRIWGSEFRACDLGWGVQSVGLTI